MTEKHLITDATEQAKLMASERFGELERLYLFGNKMALYDAVVLSNELKVGLPSWAAKSIQQLILSKWVSRKTKWKGEHDAKPDAFFNSKDRWASVKNNLNAARNEGYIALLKGYLRAKVYRHAMLWVNDINKYRIQPTRTIELWFDGVIDHPKNAKDALKVTEEGLVGTIARCGVETLRGFVSSDHMAAINQVSITDPDIAGHDDMSIVLEMAEHHEMSIEDLEDVQKSLIRDHLKIPFEFGYNETEVIFELRKEGQYWGPKRKPPERLVRLLSSQSHQNDQSSGEDF